VTTPRKALAAAALLASFPAWAGEAKLADAAAAAREAKARDYFTDTILLDQDGKKVRFYTDVLKGHVVLLSFIFTRCTDACPLIMQKLNAVRRQLGDEFGRDVRFVSISVDPDFDTPKEMKRFAEKQLAVHQEWKLLTGKKENVSAVLKKLNEWVDNPGDHSTAFIAGNVPRGHWTKVRPDAPPVAVVEHLRRLTGEALGGRPEIAPAASRAAN
jgi:cytochrome oxidase Cu insertion factor (SCO1/SenC/PrrC family)